MMIVVYAPVVKTPDEARHEDRYETGHQAIFNPGSHRTPPYRSGLRAAMPVPGRPIKMIAYFAAMGQFPTWKKGNIDGKNYAPAPDGLLDPFAVSYTLV
jgi:hypothetical protein